VISLVPVRAGMLAAGGAEAVAEAGGVALLVGTGTSIAAAELVGVATRSVLVAESDAPLAQLVPALAELLRAHDVIVLPASPDGRDLAPSLAFALGRPLFAGALSIDASGASCPRHGGLVVEDLRSRSPFVATLQLGVRGVTVRTDAHAIVTEAVTLTVDAAIPTAHTLAVMPPDLATIDLAESPRIVAGGAGLDAQERFVTLAAVAAALGASMGGTRVITDRGWIAHERQIGTTGVVVDPQLYLALGISGAVQHTSGLGQPAHIISVNTDPHCPMMQLADLAIVADANDVLAELADRLGVTA
jgi:electron transfer flavoprotein alpha subunit